MYLVMGIEGDDRLGMMDVHICIPMPLQVETKYQKGGGGTSGTILKKMELENLRGSDIGASVRFY